MNVQSPPRTRCRHIRRTVAAADWFREVPAQARVRIFGPYASQLSRRWWLFLLAGIAWLIIAVVVLRMDIRSVTTVGLMLGAVFLFSAVYQFSLAAIQGGGWAVFRVALGVLFIGGPFGRS